MTQQYREEWRTITPSAPDPERTARHYATKKQAHADVMCFHWRIVQKRLVSKWEDD